MGDGYFPLERERDIKGLNLDQIQQLRMKRCEPSWGHTSYALEETPTATIGALYICICASFGGSFFLQHLLSLSSSVIPTPMMVSNMTYWSPGTSHITSRDSFLAVGSEFCLKNNWIRSKSVRCNP